MMVNSENKNGLKGLHNIAQGNALGLWANIEIVRAVRFNSEDFFIRTKGVFRIFRSIKAIPFRPKKIICFVHRTHADGFLRIPFPLGVAVRLSAHAEAQG